MRRPAFDITPRHRWPSTGRCHWGRRFDAVSETARERADRLERLPLSDIQAGGGGVFRGFGVFISELRLHRELLGLLVRRELKSRYKDSSLGFLWSLIRPLTMLLIYFVAIGQFLGAAREIPDFAIFVFCGLTIWGLYSDIVLGSTSSIIANAGLIKKVYLPREIFPLAATGAAIFNFLIQFGILLVATALAGVFPLTWDLLYVPAGIVVALVYGVAFGLLFSALNVYLRDIQYLVEVGLLIFFWASPVVYAWSFVVKAGDDAALAWVETVYLINPMSLSIMAFQRGVWAAGSEERVTADGITIPPQPWPADMDLRLLVAFGVGLVLLFIAQRVFSRLQGNFAQEI